MIHGRYDAVRSSSVKAQGQAVLQLDACPAGVQVDIPGDGRIAIDAERGLVLGTAPGVDVRIRCVAPGSFEQLCRNGWGGRNNLRIVRSGRDWQLIHLGHGGVIHVNGEPVDAIKRSEVILRDGDRIEPALGLVFRFTF